MFTDSETRQAKLRTLLGGGSWDKSNIQLYSLRQAIIRLFPWYTGHNNTYSFLLTHKGWGNNKWLPKLLIGLFCPLYITFWIGSIYQVRVGKLGVIRFGRLGHVRLGGQIRLTAFKYQHALFIFLFLQFWSYETSPLHAQKFIIYKFTNKQK